MAKTKKQTDVLIGTVAIEHMNLSELNAIGERVRSRYDELRAEALHEIRLAMNQYGITEKMVAASLIKRRAKRNGADENEA